MISKLPPKGTRDFLPDKVLLRNKLLDLIKNAYAEYGFSQIETPCIDDLSLLLSKQGGENEKLIYKILKRGEKLEKASADDLCDLGLRFDLTLPLARYYANNVGSLPTVVKAMQIGNVFRAERPQRGRFRQLIQCDIDIINEPSLLAEVELLLATKHALSQVGLSGFRVLINDRRILRTLATLSGFAPQTHESAFIALDKLDKVGEEGVKAELMQVADENTINNFFSVVAQIKASADPLAESDALLGEEVHPITEQLRQIISCTNAQYDITLVRGMNYYTGAIFEVYCDNVPFALAGGGRYDKLIEKISGISTPACGFSIGFERICELLVDKVKIESKPRIAFLLDKCYISELSLVLADMEQYRADNLCSLFIKAKNTSYQIKSLSTFGYDQFKSFNGKIWQ